MEPPRHDDRVEIGGGAGTTLVVVADSKNRMARQVGEYTSLALMLPASTFVGYVLGYWLDKVFGTHVLYIIFLLLGIVAGFVKLIQQLVRDAGK